jgi:hypothetical protein
MDKHDGRANKMAQPDTENKFDFSGGRVSVQILKGSMRGHRLLLPRGEAEELIQSGTAKMSSETDEGGER